MKKREILSKTKKQFYEEIKKYQTNLKPTKEIEGFASFSIVGEKNYPSPQVYNISNEEKESNFFNTQKQVKEEYSKIIKQKAKNILANTNNIYVKKTNTRILNEINDVFKAKNPTQFATTYDKELKFNKPKISQLTGILGTKNEIKKIDLTENAKTSKQIEKFINEDIKSKEAIINLYEKGVNESQIINLLSLGNFGISINRKIVPTRWAITAYDKIIENHIYKKLIYNKVIENYEVYYHSDKGNSFLIILFPDTYMGEIIECGDGWDASDFANYKNKLDKSEPDCAGGYYAAKIGILEYLEKRKKQSSYISIRLIDNYEIPLGVVFVRESVRYAIKNLIFKCSNQKELENFIKKKYPNYFEKYKNSKLLKERLKQKKLNEYF